MPKAAEKKPEDKKPEVKKPTAEKKPEIKEPVAPVVPAGPLPSEVYQNIKLNKYYEGSLERTAAEKAKGERMYNSYYYQRDPKHQLWKYFSLDVAKEVGKQLEITDPAHALNQLNTTIKYEGVSQYRDLIIEVLEASEGEGTGFSDPNVYMMLNDSLPTWRVHDLKCSFYGEDICVVSGKELERFNTSKITLGVFCKTDCKFRVQAELEAEVSLRPGKMHKIWF